MLYILENQPEELIKSLEKYNVEYIQITLREYYSQDILQKITRKDCLFLGSLSMSNVIRKFDWNPGLYYEREKYYFSSYAAGFGELLFNENYTIITYDEFMRTRDSFPDIVFVKSNSGHKLLDGQIIGKKFGCSLTGPEEIVVSAVKPIPNEYRFVVIDGKVITGSQYRKNYKFNCRLISPSESCFIFAQKAVDKYSDFDRVFVLDTTEDKVIEVNSFSCAGLYDCDTDLIIKTLENK